MILKPDQPCLARNIHNTAALACCDHRARDLLRNQCRTACIHCHDLIEIGGGEINRFIQRRRAGAIHKAIEGIEIFKSFSYPHWIGNIEKQRLAAGFTSKRIQRSHIAAGRDHPRPRNTQHDGNSPSNPARCTRNQNRLPIEIEMCLHDSTCLQAMHDGLQSRIKIDIHAKAFGV